IALGRSRLSDEGMVEAAHRGTRRRSILEKVMTGFGLEFGGGGFGLDGRRLRHLDGARGNGGGRGRRRRARLRRGKQVGSVLAAGFARQNFLDRAEQDGRRATDLEERLLHTQRGGL